MRLSRKLSLRTALLRLPFGAAFLLLVYLLGRSCLEMIQAFALSLGFPGPVLRAAPILAVGLFAAVGILVLGTCLFPDE